MTYDIRGVLLFCVCSKAMTVLYAAAIGNDRKSRFFQSRTKKKNGAAVKLLKEGVPERRRNQGKQAI